MKRSSLKTCLSSAVAALAIQTTSATTHAEKLETWEKEIELEHALIDAEFSLKEARKNQRQAFQKAGVVWAQRYTDAWGGWIYMDWDSGKKLHNSLIRSIHKTKMANRPGTPVSDATMLMHRKQMNDFRSRNGKIRRLLDARLKINAHGAKELDLSHDYYLKATAARIARAKIVAAAMDVKSKYHKARADQWCTIGGRASTLVRILGYKEFNDREKFITSYNGILKLAKSGKLPSDTAADINH